MEGGGGRWREAGGRVSTCTCTFTERERETHTHTHTHTLTHTHTHTHPHSHTHTHTLSLCAITRWQHYMRATQLDVLCPRVDSWCSDEPIDGSRGILDGWLVSIMLGVTFAFYLDCSRRVWKTRGKRWRLCTKSGKIQAQTHRQMHTGARSLSLSCIRSVGLVILGIAAVYFSQLSHLNSITALCDIIRSEVESAQYKHLAHQVALLYQAVAHCGRPLDAYKQAIEVCVAVVCCVVSGVPLMLTPPPPFKHCSCSPSFLPPCFFFSPCMYMLNADIYPRINVP